MKSVSDFNIGDIVILKQFTGSMELQSRLVEMGFVPEIKIRIVKFSPFNGLVELKIRNYHVAIRMEDAKNIKAIEHETYSN